MNTISFTSNFWAYVRSGETDPVAIAKRLVNCGIDSCDVLVGPDSFPDLPVDAEASVWDELLSVTPVSSVVLVGLPMQDPDAAERDLEAAPSLCRKLKTDRLYIMPRTLGITQEDGYRCFEDLWNKLGGRLIDAGLSIAVENHAWFVDDPDEDFFLVRKGDDFQRILDLTDGQVKVKLDGSWLLRAGEDPLSVYDRFQKEILMIDLKDFKDMKFVPPGEGLMPFTQLAERMKLDGHGQCAVEVEEHHFTDPEITQIDKIDDLHSRALSFYRRLLA